MVNQGPISASWADAFMNTTQWPELNNISDAINETVSNSTADWSSNSTADWSLRHSLPETVSNSTADWSLRHSLPVTIVLATLVCILSLFTVLANILVLLSCALEKSLRTPANLLIFSLAVTDLLIGLFSMPLYTLYLLRGENWPLSAWLCDVWLSLDYTICLVAQYTVFLITLDRFCSVKLPAKYRNWRTPFKMKVMIGGTWAFPALVFFTSVMGWQFFVGERTVPQGQCYVQFAGDKIFNSILVVSYYWVTLIVMVGLYAGVYRVLLSLHSRASAKQRRLVNMATQPLTCETTADTIKMVRAGQEVTSEAPPSDSWPSSSTGDKSEAVHKDGLSSPVWKPHAKGKQDWQCVSGADGGVGGVAGVDKDKKTRRPKLSKSENRTRKALRTITLILGAFVLFWSPYHVLVLIGSFITEGDGIDGWAFGFAYQVTYWLCYCNSPLNPFGYALSNVRFKKTFLKILRGFYVKRWWQDRY